MSASTASHSPAVQGDATAGRTAPSTASPGEAGATAKAGDPLGTHATPAAATAGGEDAGKSRRERSDSLPSPSLWNGKKPQPSLPGSDELRARYGIASRKGVTSPGAAGAGGSSAPPQALELSKMNGSGAVSKISSGALFLCMFEGAKLAGATATVADKLPFEQFKRAMTAAAAVDANAAAAKHAVGQTLSNSRVHSAEADSSGPEARKRRRTDGPAASAASASTPLQHAQGSAPRPVLPQYRSNVADAAARPANAAMLTQAQVPAHLQRTAPPQQSQVIDLTGDTPPSSPTPMYLESARANTGAAGAVAPGNAQRQQPGGNRDRLKASVQRESCAEHARET